MYEDIMARGRNQYGDIVVSGRDEVAISEQYAYGDDMLTSGDEGIGFAQARRLKRKLHSNRRRITVQGYAVAAGTPYQFGAVTAIAAGAYQVGKTLGIKIGSKYTKATHAQRFATAQQKGDLATARSLINQAWDHVRLGHPGGWPDIWTQMLGLAREPLLSDMRAKERAPVAAPAPVVVTPLVPVPAMPGTPAPAPTGSADATGKDIPFDILAAMRNAISPMKNTTGTASEDVAAQVQDAETQATVQSAGFDFKGLMPLALIGLGALALSKMAGGGSRRRGRSRSRRR